MKHGQKKSALTLLIMGLGLLLAACGPGSRETSTPETTPPAAETKAGLKPQSAAAALDGWRIEAQELIFTDEIRTSDIISYPADEGEVYALIRLKVTNESKEERGFLPTLDISGNSYLKDEFLAGGQSRKLVVLVGYEGTLRDGGFQPGETREGTLIYSLDPAMAEGNQALELVFYSMEGFSPEKPQGERKDSVSIRFR